MTCQRGFLSTGIPQEAVVADVNITESLTQPVLKPAACAMLHSAFFFCPFYLNLVCQACNQLEWVVLSVQKR